MKSRSCHFKSKMRSSAKKRKEKKNLSFFFFTLACFSFSLKLNAEYKSEQSIMRYVLSFLDEVYIGVMLSRFEKYSRTSMARTSTGP